MEQKPQMAQVVTVDEEGNIISTDGTFAIGMPSSAQSQVSVKYIIIVYNRCNIYGGWLTTARIQQLVEWCKSWKTFQQFNVRFFIIELVQSKKIVQLFAEAEP